MTLSGTITHTALNTDFDAQRANMVTRQQETRRGKRVCFSAYTVLSGDDVSVRSQILTFNDDYNVDMFGLETWGHASATIGTTAKIEVIGTDGVAIPDQARLPPAETNSTSNSTETHSRTLYQTVTGKRYWVRKGQLYRLSVENDDASNAALRLTAHLVLSFRWRR